METYLRKSMALPIILSALLIVVACDNDDKDGPDTDATALIGTWTSGRLDVNYINVGEISLTQWLTENSALTSEEVQEIYDGYIEIIKAYEEYENITFNSNGTYLANEGTDNDTGKWTLTDTTLTFDSEMECTVITLNSTTLAYEVIFEEGGELHDYGSDESLIISVRYTFSR